MQESQEHGAHENAGGSAEVYRSQRSETRKSQTYAEFMKSLRRISDMPEALCEPAAVSVLCAIEQRISANEAADLESQLPAKLVEVLDRCERHAGEMPERFGLDELYAMVADDLDKSPEEVVPIVRDVILAVKGQITRGEADDVAAQLPKDIKRIWNLP